MKRILLSIYAFTLILFAASTLSAQVAGGTLTGSVMDPSGSLIPRAKITVTNRSTGVTQTTVGNGDGFYTVPNLAPGDYQVKAVAAGFAPKATNLTLSVGDEISLPFSLKAGAIEQTVEIVDTPPSVDMSSTALSATVEGPVLRDLPLNGRNWTDLATLQPGVALVTTQVGFDQGAGRGNRGFGTQISMSGGRPSQNNYRLDGISINDYANSGPGSVLGGNLGVDAIAEFTVLTSNFSAEYGRTSGGVINAITRSGTNAFHGSAYSFFRNSAMDSRNFFDKAGAPPPPFYRYQYGGALGGPIKKDHSFFFVDYEGIKQSLSNTAVVNVPSDAIRATATDPAIIKYLGLFPHANGVQTANTGAYSFVKTETATENFVTSRINQKLGQKDQLAGTYLYDNLPFTIGDAQDLTLDASQTKRQDLVLEETHVFGPTFTNAVRGGLNRQNIENNVGITALNPLAADTSLGLIPGRTAPGVNIPGVDRLVGGVGSSPSYLFRFTTLQGYYDAFYTRGTHQMKFGFAFERLQNNIRALSNPNGLFKFKSVAAFIANTPTNLQAGIASSLTPRNLRQSLIGGYIQDDWHASPRLTLNLGLRYEMSTVPREVAGKLSVLRNLSDPAPHLGSPYFYNPTYKNFEPRFGLALDPFSNHKTSVRAGVGVFDVLPLLYQFEILSVLSSPYFQVGLTSNPAVKIGADPNFVQTTLATTPRGLGQAYITSNPKRNYVMQWNMSIQHEIAKDVTVSASYVGSRGVHQPFRVEDANIVMPTKVNGRYVWPNASAPGYVPTFINSNAGVIRALFYTSGSNYNGLQSDITASILRDFQLKAAFTYAKSMDNNSATIAGDAFGNSVPSLDFFDPSLSYGRSDFDIGKTFVISGIYNLRDAKKASAPLEVIRNGWQLGAIYRATTGTPFTPLIGGDPLGKGSSDPWDYPDEIAGCDPVNHSYRSQGLAYVNLACFPAPGILETGSKNLYLRGNASRNVITGPGISTLDVSVFKNNAIRRFGDVFNIQFRAEAFNVLNHTNFAVPSNNNQVVYDGNLNPTGTVIQNPKAAGVLQSTSTTSRQLQFAVKIIF